MVLPESKRFNNSLRSRIGIAGGETKGSRNGDNSKKTWVILLASGSVCELCSVESGEFEGWLKLQLCCRSLVLQIRRPRLLPRVAKLQFTGTNS